MAQLLIGTAVGQSDPTRASIPFHIAANGAGPTGSECGIVLMGDATDLVKAEVRDGLHGIGVPALAQLWDACRERGFSFYVWKGCAEARGVSQAMVDELGGTSITPPDYVKLVLASERVLTF